MKINKFIFYTSFLLVILCPAISFSQDLEYARNIIKRLCSPEMHGRGYVKEGDKKAAGFIQDEMMKLGLEPVSGSYQQTFEISVNTFPGRMKLTIDGEDLIPGKDYIISPGSPGLKGSFHTRNITLAGISSMKDLFRKLLDVHNKIAVIDYQLFKNSGDTLSVEIDRFIDLYQRDSILQVPALIVKNFPRMMWSVSTRVDRHPVIYISEKKDIPDINRVNIQIDQKYVADYTTRNIMGKIQTSAVSDSLIVFTAHYDHLGRMGKKTLFPGANDNASGVAMMLDLARHYTEKMPYFNYTLLFIAFGAEEAGLLGSFYFVRNAPVDLENIRFLVNLDLAGTGDEGITVVNGGVFGNQFGLLKEINANNDFLPQVRSRGEACNSDHCPFYLTGVPCFFIYTLGGIQAYHDIYDRHETLPLTGYEGYFKLLVEFVYLLF